jgi:SAM-dependent methyltransferase
VAAPVEPGTFDLVTARAVLHHVPNAEAAMANMVASLRPGGALLLIEPDFLPVSIAEPSDVRAFWNGWLAWSRERGIDYTIGRTLAPRLAALGLIEISGTAETAIYNGGSCWADYWIPTITELRNDLIRSGKVNEALVDTFSRTTPTQLGGLRRLLSLQSLAVRRLRRWHRRAGCDFASIE